MYLPPVTLAEARTVYAQLHVTAATIRLEKTYEGLYFGSYFFHIVVGIAFVAFGLSVAFRNLSDSLARRLFDLRIVGRLLQTLKQVSGKFGVLRVPISSIYHRFGRSWFGRNVGKYIALWRPKLIRAAFIYYLLYSFAFTALWSPLSWYAGFLLPHRYGLSHESFVGWLSDFAKDATVDNLLNALLVALILWGIAIFPRRCAYVLAVCSAPVIFAGIFFDPIFSQIDNHFTNLPQSSPLYAPLHRIAARAGVPHVEILVADKSKQTDETNAYVTGLGSSAQIVLWDTTIKRMPPDEVIAITGHELGHYVEHHVIIGGLLGAVSMFMFLPIVKTMADFVLSKFGRQWKITSLSDPAALPILIVCVNLLTFAISPGTNAVSREMEHRADSFGLSLTGNRLAMGRAMVDLANQNLVNPYPSQWEVFWLYDHPPFGERINFSLYGQPITRNH